MTTHTTDVNLDAWFGNTLGGAGNGNGNKMSVGLGLSSSSWPWISRFAIQIPRGSLFTGVPSAAAISAFNIHLHTGSGNIGLGSAVKFWLKRGTASFTAQAVVAGSGGVPAGADISAYVVSAGPSTGHYPGPTTDATNQASYEGSPAAATWIIVDALALGRWWFAHPEVTNLVLVGIAKDETVTSQRATFNTLESTTHPFAELVFGANSPPNKPPTPTIVNGSDGTSFTITGAYSDPDNDPSTKFEVRYDPD